MAILVAACTPLCAQPWDACNPGEERSFAPGPYGRSIGDVADDFDLPVLDDLGAPGATWNYASTFPNCDVLIFISYFPTGSTTYFEEFWNSSVEDLISRSPRNVHYIFVSYETDSAQVVARVQGMRTRVEAVLAGLPQAERDHWAPRFHYVTTSIGLMSNWITTMIREQSYVWWAWGIDRAQRIRRGGLVNFPGVSNVAEMTFTTHEARYWNFEWARERDLAAETFVEVPIWDREPVSGSITADVALPGPEVMQRFDTMLLDLTLECDEAIPVGDPGGCPEWDAGVRLDLCDADDPASCSTEIGRWITTYGRMGRWVTDLSPYLAFLKQGGSRRFVFRSGQSYLVTARWLLSDRGSGLRPYEARYLYSGGDFNETYNARHPPRQVEIPSWAERVELTALLTGHGWGVELDNCAEFCNHQHVFDFNGTEYRREHPLAGTVTGCLDAIEQGVVPNQFGTWPFGRGGLCPGLDVAPWVEDVSASVSPGEVPLTYRGLINNADYVPQPNPDPPGGFPAVIDMSSWLVFSIQGPEDDCSDGTDEDGDGLLDCDDPGCVGDPACAGADLDGDGVTNDADCAPLDSGAHSPPPSRLLLTVRRPAGSPEEAVVETADAAASSGAATVYDRITGNLRELHEDGGFARASCSRGETDFFWSDPQPAPDGTYYLVRARNWCGATPFGRSVGGLCD